MNASTQRGFTLYELLVSIMVAGVVLGVGIPNYMEFQRNNAMTGAANDLVAGLNLARAEAVKRQVFVTLCASPDVTLPVPQCGVGNGGFIVFADENGNGVITDPTDGNAIVDPGEQIILQRDDPGGTINVFGDSLYISYGTNGFARPAPGQPTPSATSILYCDERGNRDAGGRSAARVVNIAPTGRAQTMRDQADVVVAVATTGGICP